MHKRRSCRLDASPIASLTETPISLSPHTPEAISIRCQRCGANFGALPTPGNARCPFCAHEQPVSGAMLSELQRYGGSVQGELSRADDAYARAATWQQWSEQSQTAVPRLRLILPLFSGFSVLTSLAFAVSHKLGVPPEQAGPILTPLVVLPALLMVGYVFWQYSGRRGAAKRATPGHIPVACPNCGARGELVVGAVQQVCAFCRGALIASTPVMQQGVNAAQLAHRQARLEELRQERLGTAGVYGYDMSPYISYIVAGSFLLPLSASAIVFSVGMFTGEEPYSPAIFFLWAMVLAAIGVPSVLLLRRRARRSGYDAALSDLRQQFSARTIANTAGLVEWLNQHWPAKYDLTCLSRGAYFVALRVDVMGYPALLNGDLTRSDHRKPRLHLLLSAELPPPPNVPAAARALADRALWRCRQLGFDVSACEAGLIAIANPETLRVVERSPEALHQIAPALTAMAEAARALSAMPG